MPVLLGIIVAIVAAVGFAAGTAFNAVQLFLLTFVPAAMPNTPVTLDNYNSYQMIVMEHNQLNVRKSGWSKDGQVFRPLKEKYVLRSVNGDIYMINAKDDASFPVWEKFPSLFTKAVFIDKGHDWALNRCKNSGKGCEVKPVAEYRFGTYKVTRNDKGERVTHGTLLFSTELHIKR